MRAQRYRLKGWGRGLLAILVLVVVGLPMWWASADETMFDLPGDRPKARPRPRPEARNKFVSTDLPAIFGPEKEWRSYRSTARINVAVRQGSVLWSGTQGAGLIQWDMNTGAYRFFVPQIERVDARTILALCPSRDGHLWIGTNGNGLALLQRGRSKWTWHQAKDGLPGNTVQAVTVARNGDVWVGTTKGVARLRKGKWKKWTIRNGLPEVDIRAIAQASDGSIWFSPNVTAPFKLEGKRFVKVKKFPVVGSTCIVPDRNAGLWFCNDQGAVHYVNGKAKLYTVSHGLSGSLVQTIYIDVAGGVWFGTRGNGISYFRGGQWVSMKRRHGLPGLNIKGIVGASRGRLFAATFLNGAARYEKGRWSQLPIGIVGNRIHTVAYAPDGAIWVGTDSGASRYHQRYWYNYTANLPNVDVHAFAFEPSGAVWIGTYGGGVTRFDGRTFKNYDLTDGLASNKIVGAGMTPEGLWFLHPLQGLSLYNGSTWKTFTSKTHGAVFNNSHPFKAFHIAPDFRIWAGTKGSGPVVHPLNGKWTKFGRMTGSSGRGIILSVAVDAKGRHWFGTRYGLYRLHNNKIKRFTIRDGLPADRVEAVALEGEKVWIGTPKGAACFDGNSWRSFTQDMGLAANYITTIAVTPWGEKWFGTKYDGLTVYRGE